MPIQVPEQARCLTCGYQLRGLDEPVCPECSRQFDPDDPKTFNADPPKRWRRRLIKWAIIGLLIGGVGFALWPGQILKAQITFTAKNSGHITTFERWKWQAPAWIPIPYPSFHWRSETKGSTPPGPDEPYSFQVNAKGGWAGGTFTDGEEVKINGIFLNPDHANEIMKALLAPDNQGMRVEFPGGMAVGGSPSN